MKIRRVFLFGLGFIIFGLFLLMAICPNIFTSYGLKETFTSWEAPSINHILGTDDVGYDIFSEIVYGTKDTLIIGICSSLLSLILGLLVGILSSLNNWVGKLFNGVLDIFIMIPKTICLIVFASILPNNILIRILLIGLFSFSSIARAIKEKCIILHNSLFIKNLRIEGFSNFHIFINHYIPNLYDIIISSFLVNITKCILLESTLSFLGLGDIYKPTWGTIVNLAFKRGAFFNEAYNYLLGPVVCISLLSISFYLMSLGVKDYE